MAPIRRRNNRGNGEAGAAGGRDGQDPDMANPNPPPPPFPVSSDLMEFESGLASEPKQIVWRINNFTTFIDMAKGTKWNDIHYPIEKIAFTMGDSIGMSSKWKFSLVFKKKKSDEEIDAENENSRNNEDGGRSANNSGNNSTPDVPDRVGLYLSMSECKVKASKVFVKYDTFIKYPDGRECIVRKVTPTDMKGVGDWGWDNLLTLDYLLTHKLLQNDCLTVLINLNIFGAKETSCIGPERALESLEKGAKGKALVDFGELLVDGSSADFTIKVPKDGDEYEIFKVHKAILGARSPVFKAMFETGLSEVETGEVCIKDMGPTSMKVLLKFLYSGSVDKDWTQAPAQVILAGDKYEVPELKEYCDKALYQVVTTANALDMLNLCKIHNLQNALKFVSDFIKSKVSEDLLSLF